MTKCTVLDRDGKEKGFVDLPDDIFGVRVNTDVIHQAVVMYQASLRQGNACTKTRKEVSGGGRKPYKQKGTGRARAGSSRSPLWKGGGVTFGPKPRDFSYDVPKKIRKSALRASLNARFQSGDFHCVADLKESFSKTKEFVKVLENLKIEAKTLALLDGSNDSIARVTNNIPRFEVKRACDVNAYDVLKYKKILVTETGVANLLGRISK